MKPIPVAGPWITDLEVRYAADAAANGWYERAGEYLTRFERAVADYVGAKYAVALPHCTSAIHLALVAFGVGPGDEVIVPDATWIASAAPIHYVGATPVFADVDEATWCLDPSAFEACITPRTKAVIPVGLYGGMPDLERIRTIARARDIAVIEDAAEAIGSVLHGRKAGAWGDVGVFSFHGSKTVATGEGGMLVTDREDVWRRVLFLRDHGRQPGDTFFFNTEVGFKYRMSPVQAAVGLAQIERVEELVGKKRQLFDWYREGLAGLPGVTLNAEPPGVRNSYWMSTVLVDRSYGLDKRALMDQMAARGIATRPFFHPLSSLPAYARLEQAALARDRNHVTYRVTACGINVPSALCLSQDDVSRVCSALREVLTTRARIAV